MIICQPYDENCILAYNRYGEFTEYKIVWKNSKTFNIYFNYLNIFSIVF
jgi:hypothetical protein